MDEIKRFFCVVTCVMACSPAPAVVDAGPDASVVEASLDVQVLDVAEEDVVQVEAGKCGNGVIDLGEACDGPSLGGATCASVVAPGWVGALGCTSACKLDPAGCATPATTFNDMTNAANWTTFDVTSVDAQAKSFIDGAFDGRYLYLFSYGSSASIVARYDTQATFASTSSWSTFPVTSVNPAVSGFVAGAFDGRYLYLVPDGLSSPSGIVARYDTSAPFTSTSSWTTFDTTTVATTAKGFFGAVFDGRYLYLEPGYNGAYDGIVVRYDTQAAFGSTSSWSTFDVAATIDPNAKFLNGATFDGRYVYMAPGAGAPYGGALRFDTTASFTSGSSWASNDIGSFFAGSIFDGKYVYFVPNSKGAAAYGVVTRYDTTTDFITGSWTTFDTTTITAAASAYVGGGFDGRFVYFVPWGPGPTHSGLVVRYDSTAAFATSASWQTFDLTSVNSAARGFNGCVFDGRYLYLAPALNAVVARFDTKSPSWLPRYWSASFF